MDEVRIRAKLRHLRNKQARSLNAKLRMRFVARNLISNIKGTSSASYLGTFSETEKAQKAFPYIVESTLFARTKASPA